MNKLAVFNLGLFLGMILISVQDLYLQPYKKGYVQGCIDIHNDWYKRLDIKNPNQDDLKRFCENKTK